MKSKLKLSPALEKSSYADWMHPLRVIITVTLVAIAAVLVWVMPLRPTYSAFEQRELARFPAFSWESLAAGTYFDDVSLWFSDTFPAREWFVEMGGGLKRLYGVHSQTIHGTVTEGDEIPEAPTRPSAPPTTGTTTSVTSTGTATTTLSSTTAATTAGSTATTTVDPAILQQNQSLGAIIVKGDTAYEYYTFVRGTADRYVGTINRLAAKLDGVPVYSMVVPTSIDVKLPAEEQPTATSDQGAAIEYLYGSLAATVQPVPVRDALLAHRNEYLYFHTDHHWTARGAYYAYAAFARQAGKTPAALTDFDVKEFPGFLGSFYAQTQDAGLKLGGDTVFAYQPRGNVSLVIGKSPSTTNSYPLLADVTNWSARYKYSTFIGGDNGYSCITNEDITDGSSIAVVKDSYGNAFAPFLSTLYHKVHIVDFRHFVGDFAGFVKNNGIQGVLVLNNISATRNGTLVTKLESFVGK